MSKLHVLVVDDELDNRVMMRYFLESWGYEVTIAANGQEALERVAVSPPDLILLDLEMPVLNGFETCDRLKSSSATESIPVIMFTGLEKTEAKVRGIRKGADDYVVKTVDPEELQARIEMVLRRSRRAPVPAEEQALSGSLSELYFPEMMQLIVAYGKSGLLRLNSGAQEAKVFLHEGQIVHAELEGREGEEALYELALWKSGRFTFQVGEAPARQTINKSGTNLLLEATRRLDEWNLISTKIPSFQEVPSRVPLSGAESVRLSRLDWRLLALADGSRTIEQIIQETGIERFEVGRLVFGLITVGLLTLGPAPVVDSNLYQEVPELVPEPGGEGLIQISALQWKVVSHVDGRRSAALIAQLTGLSAKAVLDVLEGLAAAGWVRIPGRSSRPRPRPRAAAGEGAARKLERFELRPRVVGMEPQ